MFALYSTLRHLDCIGGLTVCVGRNNHDLMFLKQWLAASDAGKYWPITTRVQEIGTHGALSLARPCSVTNVRHLPTRHMLVARLPVVDRCPNDVLP
jgi:hypothetical protein